MQQISDIGTALLDLLNLLNLSLEAQLTVKNADQSDLMLVSGEERDSLSHFHWCETRDGIFCVGGTPHQSSANYRMGRFLRAVLLVLRVGYDRYRAHNMEVLLLKHEPPVFSTIAINND